MKNQKFSIPARLKSFSHALNGIKVLFREEHNAWVHLAGTIAVISLGVWTSISSGEWVAIVFAIGFVWGMELINSAVERMADHITTENNQLIKHSKDMAAAGVLLSAITAVVIAVIIFIPKIIN
ncbi:MAG: diacylglycerol kinase family protein [Bacteroidetes bacterium]|nr:diacylglycerol kinase family protein [Bacteroidota bacterium]